MGKNVSPLVAVYLELTGESPHGMTEAVIGEYILKFAEYLDGKTYKECLRYMNSNEFRSQNGVTIEMMFVVEQELAAN